MITVKPVLNFISICRLVDVKNKKQNITIPRVVPYTNKNIYSISTIVVQYVKQDWATVIVCVCV